MEEAGHLVVRGMVPRAYYEEQKKAGFLLDEPEVPAARIPLNEKRLQELEAELKRAKAGKEQEEE